MHHHHERTLQQPLILGFLLQTAKIRNNFEGYDAFVELARALEVPKAQVIMSRDECV